MHIKTAVVALLVAMVVVGCNREKSKAESMVKDFLKENLVENDFKVMDFSRLDSTTFVSDSMAHMMRMKMANNPLFKPEMNYQKGHKTRKLYFIRVKYRVEKDTLVQTFYFDDEVSRIVSFKEG